MKKLFDFLLSLSKKAYTGKIILHFHQGALKKISEEREVKI